MFECLLIVLDGLYEPQHQQVGEQVVAVHNHQPATAKLSLELSDK
jgi:hypothetical protein